MSDPFSSGGKSSSGKPQDDSMANAIAFGVVGGGIFLTVGKYLPVVALGMCLGWFLGCVANPASK